MADKSIGELKKAAQLDNESLLLVEQSGEAMSISGALVRKFAEDAGAQAGRAAVTDEVERAEAHAEAAAQAQQNAMVSEVAAKNSETNAKTSENAAEGSAANAAASATNAAKSADKAVQYSGNPPRPINGTWWVWNATTGEYEDTGIRSVLTVVKSYGSVAEMEEDVGNHTEGDLVIIASDVEVDENSRLYVHTGTGWRFLSDLSGIQGPPGKSAYDVAKENGYDGTEATFWQDLATFKESVNAAIAAAADAEMSKTSAEQNARDAEAAAQDATEKANKASGYANDALTSKEAAEAAQAAAEKARDEAEGLVGGDYATKTEAQGYANTAEGNANAYTDEKIAGITVPVQSVNGKTGAVQLGASDVDALPLSGGTMTGPITLPTLPDLKFAAATGGQNKSPTYFATFKSNNITNGLAYSTLADVKSAVLPTAETWTFTLEDGTTVTKAVYVG